jgi:hypothetical protein
MGEPAIWWTAAFVVTVLAEYWIGTLLWHKREANRG